MTPIVNHGHEEEEVAILTFHESSHSSSQLASRRCILPVKHYLALSFVASAQTDKHKKDTHKYKHKQKHNGKHNTKPPICEEGIYFTRLP